MENVDSINVTDLKGDGLGKIVCILVSCNSLVYSCKLLLGNVYSSLSYIIK